MVPSSHTPSDTGSTPIHSTARVAPSLRVRGGCGPPVFSKREALCGGAPTGML